MGKMTKDELQRRKAELKKMVHADVVKREVMQFRLEPENIERLYKVALKKRKPVGTLIREWVSQRIESELGGQMQGTTDAEATSLDLAIERLRSDLRAPLDEIKERISVFETIAQRLEQPKKKS